MIVTVNGDRADVKEGATVTELVTTLVSNRRGVAVAVNGEVVPRSAWERRRLGEGDRIEVLTAVGGG